MNKFEAVLIFTPDLNVDKLNKCEDQFKEIIVNSGGTVINKEDWGLRDLSYNIKKNKKAFYKFYQLEIEGNKIQEINKILNQKEEMLRHLFVKKNEHEELPTKILKSEQLEGNNK